MQSEQPSNHNGTQSSQKHSLLRWSIWSTLISYSHGLLMASRALPLDLQGPQVAPSLGSTLILSNSSFQQNQKNFVMADSQFALKEVVKSPGLKAVSFVKYSLYKAMLKIHLRLIELQLLKNLLVRGLQRSGLKERQKIRSESHQETGQWGWNQIRKLTGLKRTLSFTLPWPEARNC